MKKGKRLLTLLLAVGMTLGVVGCAKLPMPGVGADELAGTSYSPTITARQGHTIALLGGDIYQFASNYTLESANKYAVGDYATTNRYAPKPARLTWENSREGALYYTVKVGREADLSDAEIYVVNDTKVDVEYLFAAKKYYYQIYAHYEGDEVVKSRIFDFKTADLPRTVWIEGVSNTRDLGGRLTVDGKHRMKQGIVYRGGEVDASWGAITEEGKRVMLYELGIKTDLDLREGNRKVSPIDASLNFINVSAPYYVGKNGINDESYKEALTTEIRTFANPDNYPIYLHCSLGRDRAGTLSFLLSALCGVGKEDLYRDYEMSHFSVNGWAEAAQNPGLHASNMAALNSLWIFLQNYGTGTLKENTEAFCINYLGITKAEIESIRSIMLEEV